MSDKQIAGQDDDIDKAIDEYLSGNKQPAWAHLWMDWEAIHKSRNVPYDVFWHDPNKCETCRRAVAELVSKSNAD